MPDQLTLCKPADHGFEVHRKPTRRDVFPAEMDKAMPWALLYALIEPFYPKPRADGGGRPAVGLEHMLRIRYFGMKAHIGIELYALTHRRWRASAGVKRASPTRSAAVSLEPTGCSAPNAVANSEDDGTPSAVSARAANSLRLSAKRALGPTPADYR